MKQTVSPVVMLISSFLFDELMNLVEQMGLKLREKNFFTKIFTVEDSIPWHEIDLRLFFIVDFFFFFNCENLLPRKDKKKRRYSMS